MKKYLLVLFFFNVSIAYSQLNTAQEIVETIRIKCGINTNWFFADDIKKRLYDDHLVITYIKERGLLNIKITQPRNIFFLKELNYDLDWYINNDDFGLLITDLSSEDELVYEIGTYMYLILCFINKQLDEIIFVFRSD
jgi:hypothetical protein